MNACLGRWVSAFVDGEVSGARYDRMVSHLGTCQECRRAVALERATKQLITTGQQVTDDGRVLELEAPRQRRLRKAPYLAAAAIMAVAGTAGAIGAKGQPSTGPVVTPPIAQFTSVHYGATLPLPVGGPALGIAPAAFRSPGP